MIGVDLIHIQRMERFFQKYGIKAYGRFLRPEEIALASSAKTAAGFWSAKEATSKALGCGIGQICSFFDIWIKKDKLGKPHISLSKKLIEKYNIKDIDLSISHDKDYAIAVVAIECENKKEILSH